MLEQGQQFNTSQPVVYWAQSVDNVLISVKLHPEMDTPICKESFERQVDVLESEIRVTAYCMQYIKPRVGIAKTNSTKNEKAFDLDRKRDDESIIDVQSLKDPDYQIGKK